MRLTEDQKTARREAQERILSERGRAFHDRVLHGDDKAAWKPYFSPLGDR